jgi:DNA-binding transcriptional ArsR family regulator/uncharacterized protein YndB with AHSA1/START domain
MDPRSTQAMIDAIASPVRREILWLTWSDELAAGEIGQHFDLSAPTLSSHLTSLRDAGLVTMRRDGNFRRYRCNQDAVRMLVPFLAVNDARWEAADDVPERDLASSEVTLAVTISVEVPVSREVAFDAFANGDRYSEWLGVPVHIRNGRFRARLEWGTEARGTYEIVHPPELIAMRWGFDDDAIPVPTDGLDAYLRVHPARRGSRVEVHQLATDERQLQFLRSAWSMVLGRFADAHKHGQLAPVTRTVRPKKKPSSP